MDMRAEYTVRIRNAEKECGLRERSERALRLEYVSRED
jgi:hypothetical protein